MKTGIRRFGSGWLALALLAIPATGLTAGPGKKDGTAAEIRSEDIRRHIGNLASEKMQGRLTGTSGERKATDYVARYFQSLKLRPAGDRGTFFQSFEFTSGVKLGKANHFRRVAADGSAQALALNKDWRPLAFSESIKLPKATLVFAGYGIVAPAGNKLEAYDSYAGLDVKGKWVLVLRYLPEGVSNERRQHLTPFSQLGLKAAAARNNGAVGIIIVSGPNSQVKEELVRLQGSDLRASGRMAAVSVTNAVAEGWLTAAGKSLKALQDELDKGGAVAGFSLDAVALSADIEIIKEKRLGRNVLGRLTAGAQPAAEAVVVGAHVDHLGKAEVGNSLARPDEKGKVIPGADDNASGVAGMLELAEYLSAEKAAGRLTPKRDVIFAAWSGEELGLLGSAAFARTFGGGKERDRLSPDIAACFNMDMIGRLQDNKLVLQGIGSSTLWKTEVENQNRKKGLGLELALQNDSYLPTDATSFYIKGVPILSAFTGVHTDYHTPRDTPDKINYDGAAKVAQLMGGILESVLVRPEAPDYQEMKKPEAMGGRGGMRVTLGTIPDMSRPDAKGLPLSGARPGGPADKAGIQKGDIVVGLAGKKIESIYDYTYIMSTLKVGQPVEIEVQRGDKVLKLTITPVSRD